MNKLVDYKTEKIARLRDPRYAQEYLNASLEEYFSDGDNKAFLIAIQDIARAQGGMSRLANNANLRRQSLYKALSGDGNPRLDTLHATLTSLGFKLQVELVPARSNSLSPKN